MPSVTLPKAAYWPLSEAAVFWTMKNCELAELQSDERAIEMVPRTWAMSFFNPVGRELALDGGARASGAVTVGVAALDHEVPHHAVEGEPVVEALLDQAGEVGHGDGRNVCVEGNRDGTVVRDFDGRVVDARGVGAHGLVAGIGASV